MSPTTAATRWARVWHRCWTALDPRPDRRALMPTTPCCPRRRSASRTTAATASASTSPGCSARSTIPAVWVTTPIVDGDRASVSWWASLIEEGADTMLAETSVLRFDADGMVIEQWDTWAADAQRRPPPRWATLFQGPAAP